MWLLLLLLQTWAEASRPNIVFIFNDDQDLLLNSMQAMQKTASWLGPTGGGVQFNNGFCTTPVCCPSRSVLISGQLLHNNKAINNSIEGNCSSIAWQQAKEDRGFPVYLNESGYSTFFAGKYLNNYGDYQAGGGRVPKGWGDWHGLYGNSVYYNYLISENGNETKHGHDYQNDYLPLIIQRHARNFIRQRASDKKPFFAMLSMPSPHDPLDVAPQYNNAFPNIESPKGPNYNRSMQGKEWFVSNPIPSVMSDVGVRYTNVAYRKRLQTLLSVDDIVDDTLNLLQDLSLLNNTYVFFSADNGFHLGQFGVLKDKRLPYETDLRVPFYVRPPNGTPAGGREENATVTIVDLPATFLDIAGIPIPADFDGKSILPFIQYNPPPPNQPWRNTFLVEYSGEGTSDPTYPYSCTYQDLFCYKVKDHAPYWDGPDICHCEDSKNNTYACIRHIAKTQYHTDDWVYCEFSRGSNQNEFYDFTKDPFQLENTYPKLTIFTQNVLKNKLAELRSCTGASCFSTSQVDLEPHLANELR